MLKANKKSNFDIGLYNESLTLILGAPRSGTTLFAAMLSAHPESCILMEDYYGGAFRILSKKIAGVKLCTPNQIALHNNKSARRFKKAANLLFKLLLSPFGIERKFLVTSEYSITDYIERSKSLKIIYIIRNPVDAIESEIKRNKVSFDYASKQWLESVDIYKQLIESKQAINIICIDYNDMVDDAESTMKRVFQFLDTEYDDKILEGFKYTPQYKGRSGIETGKKSEVEPALQKKYSKHLDLYSSIINDVN